MLNRAGAVCRLAAFVLDAVTVEVVAVGKVFIDDCRVKAVSPALKASCVNEEPTRIKLPIPLQSTLVDVTAGLVEDFLEQLTIGPCGPFCVFNGATQIQIRSNFDEFIQSVLKLFLDS